MAGKAAYHKKQSMIGCSTMSVTDKIKHARARARHEILVMNDCFPKISCSHKAASVQEPLPSAADLCLPTLKSIRHQSSSSAAERSQRTAGKTIPEDALPRH